MDNFIPVSYSNLRKANKIVNLALRGRPRSDFSFLRNDGHRQRDISASALLHQPPRRFFNRLSSRPKTQFCTQKPFSGALDSQTRPSQPPATHERNSKLKPHMCRVDLRKYTTAVQQENNSSERLLQIAVWLAEGVYILWLFLLPYAPVWRPVWAISSDTVNSLVGLSLNSFFILHFIYSAFLIPYMAIRLNEAESDYTPSKGSQLGSVMTNGAPIVGLAGGAICPISALWALFGRMDGKFGSISERWEFLIGYLGSERLAYAFIWDICPYAVFQPWLIGDNLQDVESSKIGVVNYLRFVPVVGLVAYLVCLNLDEEL